MHRSSELYCVSFTGAQGPGYSKTVVAFSDDSKILVISYDKVKEHYKDYPRGLVRIWPVKSGRNLYESSFDSSDYGIRTLVISTDLEFVAICDFGYELQVWEPLASRCVYKLDQWGASGLKFSSDANFLAVMNMMEDVVQIWEIATGACLFCVDGGDRVSFFDATNGDSFTDDFMLKNSSWKHWHKLPRHGYSLKSTFGETWICLDGQETRPIRRALGLAIGSESVSLSSSLVAITRIIGQALYSSSRLSGQEATIFDSHSMSHPHLNHDTCLNVDVSYLTDEDFGPKKKT